MRGIGLIQCGELDLFGSGLELLESPCLCGIEPPGSISHVVIYIYIYIYIYYTLQVFYLQAVDFAVFLL